MTNYPKPLVYMKAAVIVVAHIFLMVFFTGSAAGVDQKPRVTLFVVEHMELPDITASDAPNLLKTANRGAIGLVALQKVFAYEQVHSAFYATIGAGTAACGTELTSRYSASFDLKKRARHIALLNKEKQSLAHYGALGQALHEQGQKTTAIGGASFIRSDTEFLNAVMDGKGRIDYLAVDNKDNLMVISKFKDFYSKSSLTVITNKLPDSNNVFRKPAIRRVDDLLGRVTGEAGDNDMLIVLMPFSKASMSYGFSEKNIAAGEPLSSVIIQKGKLSGVLSSATTRRTGVINASDIMPTILNHLKVKTKIKFTGRPALAQPFSGNRIEFLKNLSNRAIRHDAFMFPVLIFMSVFGLTSIAMTLIAIAMGRIGKGNYFLRSFLVAVFLFPGALNMLALFDIKILWLNLVFIIVILLFSIPLVMFAQNKLWPMIVALALTTVPIIADVFLGQNIVSNSMIGNSLLAGGRYYGLGNQYLGLLFIFTVLLFIFLGLAKPGMAKKAGYKIMVGLVFMLLVVGVGSASFGANFGGLITLAVALPLVYFKLMSKTRLSWKHILFFGTLAVVIIFSFTLYDVLQKPLDQSHTGRSIYLVKSGAIYVAVNIIKVKIAHNLEEVYVVLIKWGALPFLLVIGALSYASRRKMLLMADAFPLFKRCLPGILLAALTAYLYNDTGFEPLAIITLYTLAAFLYLWLSVEEQKA